MASVKHIPLDRSDEGSETESLNETATFVGSCSKSDWRQPRVSTRHTSGESTKLQWNGIGAVASDSENEVPEGEESVPETKTLITRMAQIDFSPEAKKKREEAYNKWLDTVK